MFYIHIINKKNLLLKSILKIFLNFYCRKTKSVTSVAVLPHGAGISDNWPCEWCRPVDIYCDTASPQYILTRASWQISLSEGNVSTVTTNIHDETKLHLDWCCMFTKLTYTRCCCYLSLVVNLWPTLFQMFVKKHKHNRRFLDFENISTAFWYFLPRDALQCKARYCYHMKSACPSVCLWRWWIMTT